MKSVLYVGYDPKKLDFTDPDLPAGLSAEKIGAGIERSLADMRSRGWEAEFCSLAPDDTAEETISEALQKREWDCIVIGAGIRVPPKTLPLFEKILHSIRRYAKPSTAVAFNSTPGDTADAAARWLEK